MKYAFRIFDQLLHRYKDLESILMKERNADLKSCIQQMLSILSDEFKMINLSLIKIVFES